MRTPQAATMGRETAAKYPSKTSVIMMSGLPGTGKTYFSQKLAERLPLPIIESDSVRKQLFPKPSYSPTENTQVFQKIHRQIEALLDQGSSVIFDATNLEERHRRSVYRIADKYGARMIIVQIEAPPELVKNRLLKRVTQPDSSNYSDADWNVYRRMKSSVEKISLPHFRVNTAGDITPIIDKIVREIRR